MTKLEAIKKLLAENEELYVVDIEIKDCKKEECIYQWVIYNDLDQAENYLSLVENWYIELDEKGSIRLMDLKKAADEIELDFRYIQRVSGDEIYQKFKITKIEES